MVHHFLESTGKMKEVHRFGLQRQSVSTGIAGPLAQRALEGPAAGLQRQAAAAREAAVAAPLVAGVADLEPRTSYSSLLTVFSPSATKSASARARFQAWRCKGGKPLGLDSLFRASSSSVMFWHSRASAAQQKGPATKAACRSSPGGPFRYPAALRPSPSDTRSQFSSMFSLSLLDRQLLSVVWLPPLQCVSCRRIMCCTGPIFNTAFENARSDRSAKFSWSGLPPARWTSGDAGFPLPVLDALALGDQ